MSFTLVLGASPNEHRYANIATKRLLQYGHKVSLVGKRKGEIDELGALMAKDLGKRVATLVLKLKK